MKWTKNKIRLNLGLFPNDEKPKEQSIKLMHNLEWHPNDEKPNEQRRNWDQTQNGVALMQKQRNKQLRLDRT